ncbi:MAG: hypothetical protein ACRENP_28110 [Longimicrobiales bacterium]
MIRNLVLALAFAGTTAGRLPAQAREASWLQRLDGVVNADETAGWIEHKMEGGGQVYLRRSGNVLEIAIRTSPLMVASLCLATANRVTVLHASAALGSVTYTRSGSSFHTEQAFEWRMREGDMSPATHQRRLEYFTTNGWVANTTRMGTPGHVELRLALDRYPPEDLYIALGVMNQLGQVTGWPQSAGACAHAQLVAGTAPRALDFSTERWISLPR